MKQIIVKIIKSLKKYLGVETKLYKRAWKEHSKNMQKKLDLEHQWNKNIEL